MVKNNYTLKIGECQNVCATPGVAQSRAKKEPELKLTGQCIITIKPDLLLGKVQIPK